MIWYEVGEKEGVKRDRSPSSNNHEQHERIYAMRAENETSKDRSSNPRYVIELALMLFKKITDWERNR